jgi:hypothetical protein
MVLTKAARSREVRARADGTYATRYVYVEDNGRVRSLTSDELAYLNETFHPADGGRPYIKSNYQTLTPDGKMSGFLLRRKLPHGLAIEPV